MDYKQFIGPTYNLDDKDASVQRTINMLPVPNEPGNERAGWVLKDAPGLDVFYPADEDVGQIGSCIFVETFTGVAGDIASSSASFHDPDISPTGFTYRTYGFTDAELDGNGYLVPPTAATAIGVEATLGGWTLSPTLPYYLQFKVLINGDTAGNGDLMAWTLADSGASAQIYLEVNYDLIPGQYAVSLQVDDGVATNSDNWQLTGVGVQDVILNVTSASVDVYANTVLMGTIYADMTAFTAYDSMQFAGNAFVNGNGDRSFMIDKAAMCEDATIVAVTPEDALFWAPLRADKEDVIPTISTASTVGGSFVSYDANGLTLAYAGAPGPAITWSEPKLALNVALNGLPVTLSVDAEIISFTGTGSGGNARFFSYNSSILNGFQAAFGFRMVASSIHAIAYWYEFPNGFEQDVGLAPTRGVYKITIDASGNLEWFIDDVSVHSGETISRANGDILLQLTAYGSAGVDSARFNDAIMTQP